MGESIVRDRIVAPATGARATPSAARPRLGAAGARLTFVVLVGALIVAALGARYPVVFAIFVTLAALVAVCVFAHARPAQALTLAFFLLPVAQTKFRVRSAAASAAGEVDAQVVVELGLYAVIAAIAVLSASSSAFRRRSLTRVELLLGAYVGVAMTSALWSETPMLTLAKGGQLAILFLLVLVAVRTLGSEGVLRAVARTVVPYVVSCALIAAVMPGAASLAAQSARTARFSWFAVHPITAAVFTGVAIVAVYTGYRYSGRPRATGATFRTMALLAALLIVLASTRSRGPAIAVIGAVIVMVSWARAPRWLIAAAGAAALVLVAAYANSELTLIDWLDANDQNAVVRFMLRNQSARDVAEFSGRDELWRAAGTLFAAKPVLGYGYGGARPHLLDALPWAGDAHNALIQTLLDVGMLGTLPLLAAIGLGLTAAARGAPPRVRSRPTREATAAYVQAAVLGYLAFALLNSMTDVCFAEPGFLFLLVAACLQAAELLGSRQQGRVAA